tara:strand:- start:5416 stop:5895 length:480 start_codon:yes stop_codon:yes gene_type:complete
MFEKGRQQGFEYLPAFHPIDHTGLDVSEQYWYAKKYKYLTKDDEANYNNRWLQFNGNWVGKTEDVVKKIRSRINADEAHIYASWIANGHQYGRHNDNMSVLIVQVWNSMAYCVESEIGDKQHTSFVLNPGDALYIHRGTWHTPVIYGERMTLSFSGVDI